ncbi:hypothetical protein [Streptomyces sp. yr375]|uniref:hypothetical protein n=1 Tax=Streptomyces sp. yr375 TaxID=1761906 RepID=UPI000B8738ED|nr:hypothetical protein [Streptomyces sp. yr375]
MAGNSSTIVTGLTAAALATVGFLAFQASATAPADLAEPLRSGAPVPVPRAHPDKEHPAALPADSGVGARVVYALDDDRVWLVAANGKVNRTFKVAPGSVDPPTGAYSVTSRSGAVTGTDGTPIEHVVRFATVDDVTIGFSAALDGSLPEPDPTVRTGGIRESVADGDAMWGFATIGQSVVVVP